MLKTHTCDELRASHAGQVVRLAGWVNKRRDFGNLVFIDLRDRWGVTQIVIDANDAPEAHATAEKLRGEFVIQAIGTVTPRSPETVNPRMTTGEIEVKATAITILNPARTPVFEIMGDNEPNEQIRMKYRYLDLRRPRMQRNMVLRNEALLFIRNFLHERGFIEIETPILFKSTPEGARDYLVPSRVHPGQFFALPQSPQQLKQLLMVAGFEKYFQVARCFRDEDQRGDRQPEFTQLDMEMSFVERDDVMNLVEELMIGMVSAVTTRKLTFNPFPRIAYNDAIERFGTDRPDLRFGIELKDVSDIVARSDFKVFTSTVEAGNRVRGIAVPGCAEYSRKDLADLEEIAKEAGAHGLASIAVQEDGTAKSSIAKFFTDDLMTALLSRFEARPGDLILLVADKKSVVNEALSTLRNEFGRRLNLINADEMCFTWVVDFPLFEWNEEEKRWDPSHHMFTSPKPEQKHLLFTDPGAVQSWQYDLVCNGYEVAGGSIRIHERDIQERVFELVGFTPEIAKERFGHMLEAFEFGAPPHGGIAPGVDRIVMLMAGEPNIREVIAFPKTQQASDLMAGAPSEVDPYQLDELHIRLALDE